MAEFDKERLRSLAKEIQDLFVEKLYEERVGGSNEVPDDDNDSLTPPPSPSEWKNDMRGSFDWIPKAFEDRICPDPSGFDGAVDELGTLEAMFSEASPGVENMPGDDSPRGDSYQGTTLSLHDDIRRLHGVAGKWSGETASAFQANVDGQLLKVAKNSHSSARALREHYKAARLLYKESREKLMQLAVDTKNGLEQMPSTGAEADLAMGAAIATVGAGVTARFTPISAALTVLVGVLSGANASDTPPTSPLGGRNVHEVNDNLVEALRKFDDRLVHKEEIIAENLQEFGPAFGKFRYKGVVLEKPGEIEDFGKPPKGREYHQEFNPPKSL